VSEGFAFPYGLCPACGEGKLTAVEGREVLGVASLEAVRTAFEIELGGRAFYDRAASEAKDPALRDLFERFAAMEEEHMATLSRRYHVELPAPGDGFRIERAALYTGVQRRPEEPLDLFRIAIAFEERAVAFFAEAGARTPEGSPERRLYGELCAEEREHVAHRAVLPGGAVEQWPDEVGGEFAQRRDQVGIDIVDDDLRTGGPQRLRDAAAGAQRHVTLVRQAPGKHDDAGCGGGCHDDVLPGRRARTS
jgi:rubrerythrin